MNTYIQKCILSIVIHVLIFVAVGYVVVPTKVFASSCSVSTYSELTSALAGSSCTNITAKSGNYTGSLIKWNANDKTLICESTNTCTLSSMIIYGDGNTLRGFEMTDPSQKTCIRTYGDNNLIDLINCHDTSEDGGWFWGENNRITNSYWHGFTNGRVCDSNGVCIDPVDPTNAGGNSKYENHTDCWMTWAWEQPTLYTKVNNLVFENNICVLERKPGDDGFVNVSNQFFIYTHNSNAVPINNISFLNNTFITYDTGYVPIGLFGDSTTKGMVISGNKFYANNGENPVFLSGHSANSVSVTGNTSYGYTKSFVSGDGATQSNNIMNTYAAPVIAWPPSSASAPTSTPRPTSTPTPRAVATPTPTPIPTLACPPSGNAAGGTATMQVALPVAGNYKLWVEMMAGANNANSLWVKFDELYCAKVGDNTSISSDNWTWVDYQNGNTAAKLPTPIIADGIHTITLIGNAAEPGVKVNRILFTKDTTCTPVGDGGACIGIVSSPTPTVAPTAMVKPTNTPTIKPSPTSTSVVVKNPVILTNRLPNATRNRTYKTTIVASDPTVSDLLGITSSALPKGLSLTSCKSVSSFSGTTGTCVLTGTPTRRGTYSITFTVIDKAGNKAAKTLPLSIR